jgi:thiol:disulfide interchange protein DsbD|tara:strand:+ start:124 stop:606 length:483 start_codon:yes stop_codon:yes gene_type:complete
MTKIKKNLNLLLFVAIFFSYSVYLSSSAAYSTKEILNSFQEVLPADESFKFSAFQIEDRIILSWELKENCFLYKDKFEIKPFPYVPMQIRTKETPILISDEYFGEVEVFYKKVTKTFDLNKITEKIVVKYQGCNEKGFCYPLISKYLVINKGNISINKGT